MNKIENASNWSKEHLDAELEKGYNDMQNGRTRPAEVSSAARSILILYAANICRQNLTPKYKLNTAPKQPPRDQKHRKHPHSKAHCLLFCKEKSIFVNGVIMSYDVLEKEIRQLPESYLEDVSKYIQFLLYQYEQERMSALEESDEVFNAKMQKGLDDARNGRVTPLDDAFAELKQRFA